MISIKNVALALALTATVAGAKAQKVYNEGTLTYTATSQMFNGEQVAYFKGDSTSLAYSAGPATIKLVAKGEDFLTVLVDVPAMSMKKAATATPAELEDAQASGPQYAFTKTTEAKKIGDYNCVKYIAKDTRDGATYDVWITNDIKLPPTIPGKYYAALGTPVMFTYLQYGSPKLPQVLTLKSVTETKVPANYFKVPSDYDKITMSDLAKMGGRRQ